MGVGLDGPNQAQTVLAQGGQVALELIVHGVNNDGFPGCFVKQNISVGTGGGVKELNRLHSGLWCVACSALFSYKWMPPCLMHIALDQTISQS